jgi:hypothetical protein
MNKLGTHPIRRKLLAPKMSKSEKQKSDCCRALQPLVEHKSLCQPAILVCRKIAFTQRAVNEHARVASVVRGN